VDDDDDMGSICTGSVGQYCIDNIFGGTAPATSEFPDCVEMVFVTSSSGNAAVETSLALKKLKKQGW
jgi:hypothetical protein